MLQTQVPFSEIILSSYQDKVELPNRQLKEKVRQLIDLIKSRSREQGVQEACQSVKDELFAMMMEIYQHTDKTIINKVDQYVTTELSQQLSRETIHQQLQRAYITNLELYLDMVGHLKHAMVQQQPDLSSVSSSISYQDLKTLLASLIPNANTSNELQLLDSILTFDFALVASNLVLEEELSLKEDDLSSLEQLLNDSLENVGVYMALLNLWQPKDEQEEQIYRNIKIRVSAQELANGQGIHAERETLQQYLNTDSE